MRIDKELLKVLDWCNRNEVSIIIGDFNYKVGNVISVEILLVFIELIYKW